MAGVFLTYGKNCEHQPEVILNKVCIDVNLIDNDSDEYYTADEDETPHSCKRIFSGNVGTSSQSGSKFCRDYVMAGGSNLRGTEDLRRLGILLVIGKADIKGTPLQTPLGEVSVPRGNQALAGLLANGNVYMKDSAQIANLGSTVRVQMLAEEPVFESVGVVQADEPSVLEIKHGDASTRSSVGTTSEKDDSLKNGRVKILATNTLLPLQISHLSLLPSITYIKDHLHMQKDNLIHFFTLNCQIVP